MPDEFPPNSDTSKNAAPKVERVVQGEAVRRKKSLGKQFKGIFFSGDARTSAAYAIEEVFIPMAKEALFDAWRDGWERLFFGETRRSKSGPPRPGGATGHIQYNQYSRFLGGDKGGPQRIPLSKRARTTHDFDEIVLEDQRDAEEVIDRLFEQVSRFNSVSVADLYVMLGLESHHTDHKWGWEDLRGASVVRARGGGYLLNLPAPEPLN
jgi:hypothetical protein